MVKRQLGEVEWITRVGINYNRKLEKGGRDGLYLARRTEGARDLCRVEWKLYAGWSFGMGGSAIRCDMLPVFTTLSPARHVS